MGKYGWGPAVGMQKAYEMALRERCETLEHELADAHGVAQALERELAEARAYAERNAWLVVEQGKTVVAQAAVVEAARALSMAQGPGVDELAAVFDALDALDGQG